MATVEMVRKAELVSSLGLLWQGAYDALKEMSWYDPEFPAACATLDALGQVLILVVRHRAKEVEA